VIAERSADLTDAEVHSVLEVHKRLGAPNLLLEVLPCDHLARAKGEHAQNFQRLRLKSDRYSGFSKFSTAQVQFEQL
jgi:hypothetical protein